MKCYLSDNLASDLDVKKQLNKAHRETTPYKKKRGGELIKIRTKRNSFGMLSFQEKH